MTQITCLIHNVMLLLHSHERNGFIIYFSAVQVQLMVAMKINYALFNYFVFIMKLLLQCGGT